MFLKICSTSDQGVFLTLFLSSTNILISLTLFHKGELLQHPSDFFFFFHFFKTYFMKLKLQYGSK